MNPLVPIPLINYLSGFIDGDGSITIINRSNGAFRPQITIYNCNLTIIKVLKEFYGTGDLRSKKTGKCKKHENWRNVYEFKYKNKQAIKLINDIFPFLIIKKRQARLVLRYANLDKKYNSSFKRWNKNMAKKITNIKYKLKKECNALNVRGSDNNTVRRSLHPINHNESVLTRYFAGLLDSDGSFAITGKNLVAKVTLTNTHEPSVKLFNQMFNGSIYVRKHANKNWKNANVCDVTSRQAESLLINIIPFLKIKTKQAKLLLSLIKLKLYFSKMGPLHLWDKDLYKKRKSIYLKIKKRCQLLNKRGKLPCSK